MQNANYCLLCPCKEEIHLLFGERVLKQIRDRGCGPSPLNSRAAFFLRDEHFGSYLEVNGYLTTPTIAVLLRPL